MTAMLTMAIATKTKFALAYGRARIDFFARLFGKA